VGVEPVGCCSTVPYLYEVPEKALSKEVSNSKVSVVPEPAAPVTVPCS